MNKKTDGQVGYLHIPDMGQPGLNEFTKRYFPQIHKEGLIVDVRGNGGGFVSPLVIERLRRALVMVEMARNGVPQTNPPQTFLGPMVTLINEFSASDGDIFPYRFKTLGLGKLIGKRTWGGVIGIRNPLPLIDGGQLFKPEFAPYSKDGKGWIIESHGVDPDIVVDNDPAKEFHGEDQQLDRAIEEVQTEMKTKGYQLPPIPPFPNRNPANGGSSSTRSSKRMFLPNQKVVCVNGRFPLGIEKLYDELPKEGSTYTIRDIVPGIGLTGDEGEIAVYLVRDQGTTQCAWDRARLSRGSVCAFADDQGDGRGGNVSRPAGHGAGLIGLRRRFVLTNERAGRCSETFLHRTRLVVPDQSAGNRTSLRF